MPDLANPLSKEVLDDLEATLGRATETEAAIAKAKLAGIEIPDADKAVRSIHARAKRILEIYAPERLGHPTAS